MGCGPLLRSRQACATIRASLRRRILAFHTPSVGLRPTPSPLRGEGGAQPPDTRAKTTSALATLVGLHRCVHAVAALPGKAEGQGVENARPATDHGTGLGAVRWFDAGTLARAQARASIRASLFSAFRPAVRVTSASPRRRSTPPELKREAFLKPGRAGRGGYAPRARTASVS
jgi:hypothetical protein